MNKYICVCIYIAIRRYINAYQTKINQFVSSTKPKFRKEVEHYLTERKNISIVGEGANPFRVSEMSFIEYVPTIRAGNESKSQEVGSLGSHPWGTSKLATTVSPTYLDSNNSPLRELGSSLFWLLLGGSWAVWWISYLYLLTPLKLHVLFLI